MTRAAFEAWLGGTRYERYPNGDYINDYVSDQWTAWTASRAAALEEAATCAAIHSQYPITDPYDRGYDHGRKDAEAAIREIGKEA